MKSMFTGISLLAPAPGFAAGLWGLPDQICGPDGKRPAMELARSGTNAAEEAEALIWVKANTAFSHKIRATHGDAWRAEGVCEVE